MVCGPPFLLLLQARKCRNEHGIKVASKDCVTDQCLEIYRPKEGNIAPALGRKSLYNQKTVGPG